MESKRIEENPFEDERVAAEWITSVENEQGLIRDNEIYPMLEAWSEGIHGTIVDIGAGQGICSEKVRLADDSAYVGVEPSMPLVKRAEEKHAAPNRKFLQGNAYELPIENESVDGCFSINVWFHLEDVNRAAKEMARVLRSGGRFMIITANPAEENMWVTFYSGGSDDGKKVVGMIRTPVSPLSRSTFFRHSREELTGALIVAGLKIEEEVEFGKSTSGSDRIFIRLSGSKEEQNA